MYKNFIVDVEIRLDKFLSLKIDASRNQIEQLIQKEFVKVDGKTTDKNGLKLRNNFVGNLLDLVFIFTFYHYTN